MIPQQIDGVADAEVQASMQAIFYMLRTLPPRLRREALDGVVQLMIRFEEQALVDGGTE
jgi:hypothetical protein